MTNEQKRAKALAADLPHVLKIVRKKARAAKVKGGKICGDNIESAVQSGQMLLTYTDRGYKSGLYGQAMRQSAKAGVIKPAGTMRNRWGSLVVAWRAA